MTIDLTDDTQPSSCLASCGERVYQMHQPFVQSGVNVCPLTFRRANIHQLNILCTAKCHKSRLPPDQKSQGRGLEAMRIQREAFACVVEKPLSWLVGKHPFRYTRCINHLYVAESRHFRRLNRSYANSTKSASSSAICFGAKRSTRISCFRDDEMIGSLAT